MTLSESEIRSMSVSAWELAKEAVVEGDVDMALERIDQAAGRVAGLQEYSVEWITSLLSFIGEELGEEAVERALRRNGDDFVRARRDGDVDWAGLPAEARAKVIARAMVANGGRCTVEEDDDKIVLRFRCGSGGRLIDEGRYGPDGYLTLDEPAPRTFGRGDFPVYCAHCAVNNEIQPVEWGGVPVTIEHPPREAGEECVHHVYRDPRAAPADTWERIGFRPDIME